MFKRRYAALLPALILLSACSSKPKTEAVQQTAGAPSGGFLLEPQHNMMQMGGDFANNPAAEQFIDKMVSKHGFDRQQLHEILSQAKRLDYVLRLMDRQAPTARCRAGQTGRGCAIANSSLPRTTCKTAWRSGISMKMRLTARGRCTACRLKLSSGLSAWKPAGAA